MMHLHVDISCTPGELRLYNGSVPNDGMLQYCNGTNEWSAFCSYGWDCHDAMVACQQLGFSGYG